MSLAHGPDGALYVVDMCRAVIEHPEFMPPELRNRPDLLLGKEKGRIWRISAKEPKEPLPIPDFSSDSGKLLPWVPGKGGNGKSLTGLFISRLASRSGNLCSNRPSHLPRLTGVFMPFGYWL